MLSGNRPLLGRVAGLLLFVSTAATAQPGLLEPTLEAVVTPAHYGSETRGQFGSGLVMDGDHAAVTGGDRVSQGAGNRGVVHMLRDTDQGWQVTQHLTVEAGVSKHFGAAVELRGDRLFVGAPGSDLAINEAVGSVYVYEFDGNEWALVDEIVPPPPVQPGAFGATLDYDGERLIVGSPWRNDFDGAALIYERVGSAWTLTAALTPSFEDPYSFGQLVAIEGAHAIIVGLDDAGLFKVNSFTLDGGTWAEAEDLAPLTPELHVNSMLSLEGGRLLVGAPRALVNGRRGGVYVFERQGDAWIRTAVLEDANGGGNEINRFGTWVDQDGDRLIAGSPGVNTRALIFSYDGATWTQEAVLTVPQPPAGNEFGASVALQGSRVLVGAPRTAIDGARLAGSVEAFEKNADGWARSDTVTLGPARTGVRFGADVALFGSRLAIGASADGPTSELPGVLGSVYLYRTSGDGYAPEARVVGHAYPSTFGSAVALGSDLLVAGAPSPTATGYAVVYRRTGSEWTEWQALGGFGRFGTSVALDGDRLLVGAPTDEPTSGRAYLYGRTDTEWELLAVLEPDVPGFDPSFGSSVALDGGRAIVGAPVTTASPSTSGAAYVYELDGEAWVSVRTLRAAATSHDAGFGTSVALSGGRALVGAPSPSAGEAYLFEGLTWAPAATLGSAGARPAFGYDVALDGGRALVSERQDSDGRVRLYGYDGVVWTETAALSSPVPLGGDAFGTSVAVEGRRLAISAPYPVLDAPVFGSVFVFRDPVSVDGDQAPVAGAVRLGIPRPNPSAGIARLELSLPEAERVHVSVYDALGRLVQTVMHDEPVVGRVDLAVNAGRLAPGLYVVRVTGQTFAESRTLTVAR